MLEFVIALINLFIHATKAVQYTHAKHNDTKENLKYNMANELRPHSVFNSCNRVDNWNNIIFTC